MEALALNRATGKAKYPGLSRLGFLLAGLLWGASQALAGDEAGDVLNQATASLSPGPALENHLSDTALPDNPHALDQCLAKVRVDAARLREAPSLTAPIVGVSLQEEELFVQKITGKWARVRLENGNVAYVAAYLLSFSWQDMLEQWKKGAPAPTVGKKAKVKWAKLNLRPYPSAQGGRFGQLRRGDWLMVLGQADDKWTLVQVEEFKGFVATAALQAMPGLPWTRHAAPLAKLKRGPEDRPMERRESLKDYLAARIWSPELFQIAWSHPASDSGIDANLAFQSSDPKAGPFSGLAMR